MEPCPICRKPRQVPTRAFRDWWFQRPTEGVRFVPLREFLADYCTCEIPPGELARNDGPGRIDLGDDPDGDNT